MQIQEIIALIDQRDVKLAVLLCHHNADPDAVCAAFALSRLLERLRPGLDIEMAAAQGPSRLSKFLLKSSPVRLVTQPRIEEAGLIVLLDTNTIQQLDEWGERVKASSSPLIVIDHHAGHPETERLATLCVADEAASSTCEIIYRFFQEAGVEVTDIEAKALFLGIAFDTRHLVLAKSDTLKTVADLIDAGVNAEEALSLLSLPMDPSERIARLKACQRARLMRINDWLIALSYVSAYQASAARALIGLGAHVAIVAGQRGEAIQVSMRASRDFHEKTGIHLGRDVAKPLGEYLYGMGGGHSVSAGANGNGNIEASLKRCVRLLKDRLK
ncbi:MAG: putative manganese-dependent inorganic pyrophosphatase [Candidatus Bathyarchaeota archaeon BA1]|nr:MAG: putative manganese-dependent inorganic pyrophosphatase [Candidatus Bathyarchaeota archaeon BA1]